MVLVSCWDEDGGGGGGMAKTGAEEEEEKEEESDRCGGGILGAKLCRREAAAAGVVGPTPRLDLIDDEEEVEEVLTLRLARGGTPALVLLLLLLVVVEARPALAPAPTPGPNDSRALGLMWVGAGGLLLLLLVLLTLASRAFCKTALRFSFSSASLERVTRLPAVPPVVLLLLLLSVPSSSPPPPPVGVVAITAICASRIKIPWTGAHSKYLTPSIDPSFFPRPSSSSSPIHFPSANCVSPTNITVPTKPSLRVRTRSPSTGGAPEAWEVAAAAVLLVLMVARRLLRIFVCVCMCVSVCRLGWWCGCWWWWEEFVASEGRGIWRVTWISVVSYYS